MPKPDFSAHLAATSVDEEARKRAERAKRFGVVADENEEEKLKVERAKRFGGEAPAVVAAVQGLDSALPERRERKRGREGAAGGEQRDAKRQSTDGRRGGGRGDRGDRGGQNRGQDRRGQNSGRVGGRGEARQNGGAQRGAASLDPAEKARAEARAKRFGA